MWKAPAELGYQHALTFVGSTPVAILAGFSLTAAIDVSKKHPADTWSQLSLVSLALAVVALLATLALSLKASAFSADPDTRLSLMPEATVSDRALQQLREQWLDHIWRTLKLAERAGVTLGVGVLSASVGLGAAILTNGSAPGHIAAAVVCVTALPVGLLAFFEKPPSLFRRPVDEPEELDFVSRAAMFKDATHYSSPNTLSLGLGPNVATGEPFAASSVLVECAQTLAENLSGTYIRGNAIVGTVVLNNYHRPAMTLHPLDTSPPSLMLTVATDALAAWLDIPEPVLVTRLPPDAAPSPLSGYKFAVASSEEVKAIFRSVPSAEPEGAPVVQSRGVPMPPRYPTEGLLDEPAPDAAWTSVPSLGRPDEERRFVPGKFVIKKGPSGKFRFDLLATNGQVIATSETYNSKAAARNGIRSVQKLAADAKIEDQTTKEWAAAQSAAKSTGASRKRAVT